ncbi:hypothetical protein ECL_00527 [Enterobacter cloacae subsp. cloacae ATCC 13047]|uniref:Uncharacterized protein n=1 Tax=Enterobacter cloacae subsp. cloacae (strain ATCC 13047 / DSM 30054 / NBRC 13535 / NCTC 10005 / WDCM 00083 / NCDC 279-56) TaxID=716541 RepID=A0A0H3CE22_ENTCC|nr:hypothetical protein ECL_00527 [Enterobacter cloacae subsp. cloacae ATCC 13047]
MQRVIIETEAFIIYFLFSFMVFKAKESPDAGAPVKTGYSVNSDGTG